MTDLLIEQAKEYRAAARRARELSACIPPEGDMTKLLRLAEQQDARAAELEAKARVYASIPRGARPRLAGASG